MGMIATFYSYKGGVGRSMALANVASILSMRGLNVLIVDFDLEAPGLDAYFNDVPSHKSSRTGLLNLLQDASNKSHDDSFPDWRDYITTLDIASDRRLSMLTANDGGEDSMRILSEFSWGEFFADCSGGKFIESLRESWKENFDITLIDSRTGLTDSGGICTIQLPDALVAVFSANRQSLFGIKDIIARSQKARQNFAYDRMPLIVCPIASRFDGRTEFEESQHWLDIFAQELSEYYHDWLPKDISIRQAVERTKIPHVSYFSFGEKLPALTHSMDDPESIGFAYNTLSLLISHEFRDSARFIGPRDLSEEGPLHDSSIHTFAPIEKREIIHEPQPLQPSNIIDQSLLEEQQDQKNEQNKLLLIFSLVITLLLTMSIILIYSVDRLGDRAIASLTSSNMRYAEKVQDLSRLLNETETKLNEKANQILSADSKVEKQKKSYSSIIAGLNRQGSELNGLSEEVTAAEEKLLTIKKKIDNLSSSLRSLNIDFASPKIPSE